MADGPKDPVKWMPQLFFRFGCQRLKHELKVGDRLLIGRGEIGTLRVIQQAADGTQVVEAGLPTVSQEHARISVELDGRLILEDRGSTNGTYLRLAASQSVEVPDNAELLLGQELALSLNSPRWDAEPPHEATTPQRSTDLLSFLKGRLKDRVRSVRLVSGKEVGGKPESFLHELRFALIDKEQLVVEWQPEKTNDIDAADWLRTVVSRYNSQREFDCGARAWEFTAVSPGRQEALSLAKQVASSSYPILLRGPSGSGKEVLASDLHNHSPRAGHPFVIVHCGAIRAELAASRLFGHVKKASTGAEDAYARLIEQADGGTLFLDEIDEMPLELQEKLLQVLETSKITPFGGKTARAVNIHVIVATRRPLEPLVEDKTFRQDLYLRLSPIQIVIPRIEPPDTAALAKLFLNNLSEVRGASPSETELLALASLAANRVWPGGVLELRDAIERYVLLRDPTRSVVTNWNTALTTSAPVHAPAGLLSGNGPTRPEPVCQTPADAAVPERAPLSASKQVDTLLFLSVLHQALAGNPRVKISEIAGRVGLTYQGTLNRLRALDLRLDGQDALPRIQARIHVERLRLAPFLPWVRYSIAD